MMSEIGIIGLGTMGNALTQNLLNKGFRVSVFNRTSEKTDEFVKKFGVKNLQTFHKLKQCIENLQRPRKVIIMVSAGKPVDEMIANLKPLLKKGDCIMDGGNSHYKDTERRQNELEKSGIMLLGCGISGGEKGALQGPSIMPGGTQKGWKLFQPILEKIAARDFSGRPCVAYIGEGGAGHFVKMIHNGIEYALMQCISEIYALGATQKMFEEWKNGKLNGYLIEETANVLSKKDFHGHMLIDEILDVAEQKGTGIWTAQESLEEGIAVNTIFEAVAARSLSTWKDLRIKLSKNFRKNLKSPKIKKQTLENALFAALLTSFAQGFSLLEKYNGEQIARIWQGGCIIRSKILKNIQKTFAKNNSHLFEDQEIQKLLKNAIPKLRITVQAAIKSQIATPGLGSALSYFDTLTSQKLPVNLIQALRDAFGAHGFEKINQKGIFHTDWSS